MFLLGDGSSSSRVFAAMSGVTGLLRLRAPVGLLWLFWLVTGRARALDPVVAATSQGLVRGVAAGANTTAFFGVPFAAAPARFEDAAAPTAWAGTRDASRPAAKCAQGAAGEGSEDCLYLNAWSSMVPGRPVMFYVHGGGFVGGSATTVAANLTRATGSVVFAPQYRLGVFGFFDVASAGEPRNPGLGDQLAALRWVGANAAAFGGDANRVMIFGCSAGGASVAHLLVAEGAVGLFRAAALESPGGHQGWMADGARSDDDFVDPALLAANSRAVALDLGCGGVDDAACLGAADRSSVAAAAEGRRFAPALARRRPRGARSFDGVETPLGRLRAGDWRRVPVIVGGQSCESCGAAEAALGPYGAVDEAAYVSALEAQFRGAAVDAAAVEALYAPRVAKEGRWRAFARVLSDSGHACSSQLHARAVAGNATFAYYFDEPGASSHGQDESFLLDDRGGALALDMARWWASLGADLDPNAHANRGAPTWPSYREAGAPVMGLADEPAMRADDDTARPECDFWAPYLGFY